jgi:hypothetical protein
VFFTVAPAEKAFEAALPQANRSFDQDPPMIALRLEPNTLTQENLIRRDWLAWLLGSLGFRRRGFRSDAQFGDVFV